MSYLLRGCAVASAVLLLTQTASAGPLQNLRSRFSGDDGYSGPIGRVSGTIFQGAGAPDNPYQRPSFASDSGRRIRLFFGDGSFFNRYYDNNGRALGGNVQDRSGLGLREALDNWIGRVRNRQRWGAGDGTTRRIGDGLFGDGKMLKALGTAARFAGPMLTGFASGMSSSSYASRAGGGGNNSSLLNSLQKAQNQYNRNFPVNNSLQNRTNQLLRMGGR